MMGHHAIGKKQRLLKCGVCFLLVSQSAFEQTLGVKPRTGRGTRRGTGLHLRKRRRKFPMPFAGIKIAKLLGSGIGPGDFVRIRLPNRVLEERLCFVTAATA